MKIFNSVVLFIDITLPSSISSFASLNVNLHFSISKEADTTFSLTTVTMATQHDLLFWELGVIYGGYFHLIVIQCFCVSLGSLCVYVCAPVSQRRCINSETSLASMSPFKMTQRLILRQCYVFI